MALRAACGRCAHGTWSWRTRALQQSRFELAGKMISLPYRSFESRLFAFSDTARLIWSVAPLGKWALISTVILSSA